MVDRWSWILLGHKAYLSKASTPWSGRLKWPGGWISKGTIRHQRGITSSYVRSRMWSYLLGGGRFCRWCALVQKELGEHITQRHPQKKWKVSSIDERVRKTSHKKPNKFHEENVFNPKNKAFNACLWRLYTLFGGDGVTKFFGMSIGTMWTSRRFDKELKSCFTLPPSPVSIDVPWLYNL